MVERCISAPDGAALIAESEKLAYFSCHSALAPTDMSAIEAYRALTSETPFWMHALFILRDRLVKPFGLRPVGGFGGERGTGPSPDAGEMLDFFTVKEISGDRLLLVVEDTHLDVMICLNLTPLNERFQRLYLTSSVKTHNFLGKFYMAPVSVAHQIIARFMLGKIENNLGCESIEL